MADEPPLSRDAARNRRLWDERSAAYQSEHGAQLAASGGAAWGVWQIPESEVGALGDVSGRDVLELGCGAAQWSIALARAGARATALDNSARQLGHAKALAAAAGVELELVHASAESTGLGDACFDVVFCDHGAMRFADPHRTCGYWDLHALEEPGEPLAFQLPYGAWIRLFGAHGLVVEDLIELRPPADATSSYVDDEHREWARAWPFEHIWRARRVAVG